MKRFVRRLSSASIEHAPRHNSSGSLSSRDGGRQRKAVLGGRRYHSRSSSEIYTLYVDSSSPGYRDDSEHVVYYLGYSVIEDPKSNKEIQAVVRTVRHTMTAHKAVRLQFEEGMLTIYEYSGEKLLLTPLRSIAHCTNDVTKGSNDCLVVTFRSGRYAKQCHVFQANSSREASDVVQSLQKACRLTTKSRRSAEVPSPQVFSKAHHNRHSSGDSPQLGMHLSLEDEEEIVESKPISRLYRRESKRPVFRTSGETTSITGSPSALRASTGESSSSLGRFPVMRRVATPPGRSKRRITKPSKISSDFSRRERIGQLLSAAEKVVENNNTLRLICSNDNPQNRFQDALYAIRTAQLDLLNSYLVTRSLGVNDTDSNGNTLLHYATALGSNSAIGVLCRNKAMLDAAGWNECHPIHRAAADGNKSVLQCLLVHGASVNATDMMRRTPLHMAACKLERMECVIVLLEYGAQITATDVLDLRPFDLYPELKETQNRLVTSACESFVSAQLKKPLPPHLASPSFTSTSSCSPGSSRPSSMNGDRMSSCDLSTRPHPLNGTAYGDPELNHLLDEVNRKAREFVIRRKALEKKSKFRRSMTSRSFSNLSELHEAEEDEMLRRARLERLKFPSEFNLHHNCEVEGDAGNVAMALSALMHASKRTSRGARPLRVNRSSVELGSRRGGVTDRGFLNNEISLSEPNLLEPRKGSKSHSLYSEPRPQSSLATFHMASGRRVHQLRGGSITSQSSAGTLVKGGSVEIDSMCSEGVSQAFEDLEREVCGRGLRQEEDLEREVCGRGLRQEEDLEREVCGRGLRQEEKEIGDAVTLPEGLAHHYYHPELQEPEPADKRTAEETEAIFDEIIGQMHSDAKMDWVESPTSTLHDQQLDDDQWNAADTNETQCVPIVYEPLDSSPDAPKPRRFPRGLKLVLPFKRQSGSFEGGSKPDMRENGQEIRNRRRKLSLPESGVNRVFSRSSSGGSGSEFDATSSCASMDALYMSHSGSMTLTYQNGTGAATSDPVANALRVMVTLSSNKECLSTLVSYICLPKCISKLTELAQSPHSTTDLLNNIATLMQNLFESGGTEGKKNALSSGVMDLTIKLLHSRDPIPGTCLSLLNSLLVSEDDHDYLRTIVRIPSLPLLVYLEPYDSDMDSGIESRRRDTSLSLLTRSSSDTQGQPPSDDGSRPSSGLGMARTQSGNLLEVTQRMQLRASSFASELSESGTFSMRSLASPTLQGQVVTHLEARRIVLKMLAASSRHGKMQRELSMQRAVCLLGECLGDPSQENITNAVITIANIALNVDSHRLLLEAKLPRRLRPLLTSGPRPRFHAARALVYVGELDLSHVSVFHTTGYETDSVLLTTDDSGHTYARGATVEKCVEYLTSDDIQYLWGGFNLAMGLQTPADESLTSKATKEQITDFFLMTYQSFVHPTILVRLLLHRLASLEPGSPFDWSVEPDKSTIPPIPHTASIPAIEARVLSLFARWLEAHPTDFQKHPLLQEEVMRLITRMKLAWGPYIPHVHRLRSLLNDVNHPRVYSSMAGADDEHRTPHHDNLYSLCKQMIAGGHLPITVDQAVFMAALQLHTENIAESALKTSTGGSSALTKGKKSFTSRMKAALPSGYTKGSKSVMKRVRHQMLEFERLSERNAKHLYIERCHSFPGYDCTFFSVKVPPTGRFRKGTAAKQLLGIGDKRVVFLDEKTKELLSNHSIHDILNVRRESEPCSVVFAMTDCSCRCLVDSPTVAWEITNVLEQCREGEGWLPQDLEDTRWSDSLPPDHAHNSTAHVTQRKVSTSSLSTSEHSADRRTSPSGRRRASSHGELQTSGATPKHLLSNQLNLSLTTPIGQLHPSPLDRTLSTPVYNGYHSDHLNDTLRMLSRDDSMASAEVEGQVPTEEETPFCDCPPDPEIPPTVKLQHLTLPGVLSCSLEVARQMTLIAHERLCEVSAVELLHKVNLLPKPQQGSKSAGPSQSVRSLSLGILEQPETAIEKLAFRFNQVGNWVTNSILQYEDLDERVAAVQQLIIIAKHCLDYQNYSSVMAIVVAGLGSAPIRRLHKTWEGVSKQHVELYKMMDGVLESKSNYKNYREALVKTQPPAVPYIGVFLKDLTFICDGNPDYLRGGLINIHKRRQVYKKLEEIRHFQQEHFNFHVVPQLRDYLLSYRLVPEDELHSSSHALEPRRHHRSLSQTSSRGRSTGGVSTTQNFSFFRALTRSGSANLLRITS